MKQVRVEAFGGVDQLHVVDAPEPVPGPGEVVLAVEACGVNYADLMQREGMYLGGPKPPYTPGVEAAGTVVAHGPGVAAPALGARVVVLGKGGLQAERAAVPAERCVGVPAALDAVRAAAFPVTFLTAYHALTTVGRATAGEVVVIHAAGGGVGTAAVQLAKQLGLRVVATASTEAKRARVKALGADVVVGYDGFEDAVRALGGASLILESVGGEITKRSLAVLSPLGRLVIYGVAGKDARPIDPIKLLFKSQAVLGLHLDAIVARPDLLRPSLSRLLADVTAGTLSIEVGATFPLSDVRLAHSHIASRQSYGKVVLLP
jgi:NADPH2:quinone reductase